MSQVQVRKSVDRIDVVQAEADRSQAILFDALTPTKLDLILFPTEQCNFRCTYCYEDFEKGRMPANVIAGVKHLIGKRLHDLKMLQISWFGGEPMIAYDIVSDIMSFASEESRQRGVHFSASATTNGYTLTERRFIELAGWGMNTYQISLDGAHGGHNQTRRRIDGAGTFDRVWAAVCTFNRLRTAGELASGRVVLRVHVHPNNTESVRELAGLILDELSPKAVTIHIKNVGHYGGKNDQNIDIFRAFDPEYGAFLAEITDRLSPFAQEIDESTYVCYACKANSLTVRSDGSLGKCTVALSSPSNNIGHIEADGRLVIDQDKFKSWLHPLSSMDKTDLSCPVSRLPKADLGVRLAS